MQLIHNITHINPGPHVTQSQNKETFKENTKMVSEILKNYQFGGFLYVLYRHFTQNSSQSTLLRHLILSSKFTVTVKTENTHTHSLIHMHTCACTCTHSRTHTHKILLNIRLPHSIYTTFTHTPHSLPMTAPQNTVPWACITLQIWWLFFGMVNNILHSITVTQTYLSVWFLQHPNNNNRDHLT